MRRGTVNPDHLIANRKPLLAVFRAGRSRRREELIKLPFIERSRVVVDAIRVVQRDPLMSVEKFGNVVRRDDTDRCTVEVEESRVVLGTLVAHDCRPLNSSLTASLTSNGANQFAETGAALVSAIAIVFGSATSITFPSARCTVNGRNGIASRAARNSLAVMM